jgi:methylenetetrahydrofolate reductase (NADPH)
MMAIAQATELCDSLIQNGVEHLHFYTMNKAEVVCAICTALGKAPQQSLRSVA